MSDCVFCKIIAGEIPANKIYEDDEMLAFNDINPQAPIHFLLIPKKHIKSLLDITPEDTAILGRLLVKAQELAKELGCEDDGGRFVINAKRHGGQTVDHLHLHILSGRYLKWPPG